MLARTAFAAATFLVLATIAAEVNRVGAHPPSDEVAGGVPDTPRIQAERSRYQAALAMLDVLNKLPVNTSPNVDRRRLQAAVEKLSHSLSYWEHAVAPANLRQIVAQAQKESAFLVNRDSGIQTLLEDSGELERVWIRPQETADRIRITRHWFQSGTLLLRIGRRDQPIDAPAGFFSLKINASTNPKPTLDVDSADPAYAVIHVDRLPETETTLSIRLQCDGNDAGWLDLVVAPPAVGELRVDFVDAATGNPTAVAAACYAPDGRIFVPENAVHFHEGQAPFYKADGTRPMHTARYWPGNGEQKHAFVVDGGFSLRLPEGSYALLASKGMEYDPVNEAVEVKAGIRTSKQIRLKRWINMPARGWYSGDGHVHYKRVDESANPRLLSWAQAEDVHLVNVLSFGDSMQEFFPQYAYGKSGSLITKEYAIVPGQEDPRTTFLGHTLGLNIQNQVRFESRYYQFDLVFDAIHRQGGLAGHAHVANEGFNVNADMAMSVPLQQTDFAEICQFGRVGEKLFYEYLNLGFKMTASAGSDVPFGNTMGDSRMYVYTGDAFEPDAWFSGLRAGRTFVTLGPMMELTVNGVQPGTVVSARVGDKLHIKAAASGGPVPPGYLEIVSQGEVIQAVRSPPSSHSPLTLEFDLPVEGSTWIAARCAGAHTTPIYVEVAGRRFWRRSLVKDLVAKRLTELHPVEQLMESATLSSRGTIKENSAAWTACITDVRRRLTAAKAVYEELLRKAEQEQAEEND